MNPISQANAVAQSPLERRQAAAGPAPAPAPVPLSRDRFTPGQGQGRAKTAGLLAGAGTSLVLGVAVGATVSQLTRSPALGVGAAVLSAVPGGLIGTMAGLDQRPYTRLTAGDVFRTGIKGGLAGFVTTAWFGPKAWMVAVPGAAVTAAASQTAAHLAAQQPE